MTTSTNPSIRRPPFGPIALGMSLRTARLSKGRTVASVLRATGLNVSVYSRIENGSRGLELHEAVMLADELGMDLQKIVRVACELQKSGAIEVSRPDRRLACSQLVDAIKSEA